MSKVIGRKVWAIVAGNIPLDQTGPEPEFSSANSLWMLNTTGEDANIEITIYYTDRDPVGPYKLSVLANRMRHVRFNDLIDPHALPLETDYAAVIESSVPIVVQFEKTDTRQAENARMSGIAFPGSQ